MWPQTTFEDTPSNPKPFKKEKLSYISRKKQEQRWIPPSSDGYFGLGVL